MPRKFDKDMELHLPRPLTGDTEVSDAESIDTLKRKSRHQPSVKEYLLSDVETQWADIPLIVCCYVGGIVDGLSYNSWGSFTNMQTGNLIFIALGVAGKPEQPDMLWAKSLIALMSFLMGNLVFVYGSRFLGPTRRLTLILSFALQTLMLFGAALLVQLVPPMPDDTTSVEWRKAVAISLLSFQAAGQIAASRLLGFSEIPTVVLTALVCDLFLDVKLYQRPWRANAKRNRRIGAALGHFFGAMTAGGFAKEVGLAGGLWFSMSLKGSITVAWFVWSGKRQAKSVS